MSRPAPLARDSEAGLTLVEMLVVLAIVGVMAGIVALGVGTGGDRAAEREAKRLAARLTLAADEVMVTDRSLAFAWDGTSYRFLARSDGAWREDRTAALEPHDLAGGVTLAASAVPPLPIGADGGAPIEARFASRAGNWTVRFDGATATAAPGG